MAEALPLRRALVTGATGFVGSRLVPALVASGVEVVGCSRSPQATAGVRWITLGLPGAPPPEALAGVDVVFHLAARAHAVAESRADERLYAQVNEEGTVAVARAAIDAGVRRFVLASSVKAMRPPGPGAMAEDDPGMPDDPYGLSKRNAEAGARAAAEGSGMDVVVLRPALVYGPGVKGNLATLLETLRNGRRPPLPDVQNRRSLIGLRDLVKAAELCAVRPEAAGRTYVVTDGEAYSTGRIVDALARGLGVDATPRMRVPMPALRAAARAGDLAARMSGRRVPFDSGVLDRLVGDAEYTSARIGAELGFEPSVVLEDEAVEMARAHAPAGVTGHR